MQMSCALLRLGRTKATLSRYFAPRPTQAFYLHHSAASTSPLCSFQRGIHITTSQHVKFTLPDELAPSIPRDSKQRRVDTNAPLPAASAILSYSTETIKRCSLEYWKKIAREKEEVPYQKFPSSTTDKTATIPATTLHTDGPWKPLEECHTFPATTAEDWKAIDVFISQNKNSLAKQAAAAMKTKEAVESEAGTPLTTSDLALINDLPSANSSRSNPHCISATTTPPKPTNIYTPNSAPSLNRKFSTSSSASAPAELPLTNWAQIEAWIRSAAAHRVIGHRLSRGELLTGPITRGELEELRTALDQSFPGQPSPPATVEEAAAILDLPEPPLAEKEGPRYARPAETMGGGGARNIHTVNPTLDGQFSTSETIKIGQMTIKILEDGSRTENRLSSVLITLPARTRGGPMKVNERHDEGFLVVKGKVRFTTLRYLDANLSTKTAKAEGPEIKDAKAVVEAEAAVHVADVGTTSTSGDLLVPNKDMLEEILHAGARPVNVDHVMTGPEMKNEGISVDVDVKWGGWVTVPRGARYTFSNPFEEEAEMLNTFTPGGDLEEMRRMSDEGRLAGAGEERGKKVVDRPTKSMDDGGS